MSNTTVLFEHRRRRRPRRVILSSKCDRSDAIVVGSLIVALAIFIVLVFVLDSVFEPNVLWRDEDNGSHVTCDEGEAWDGSRVDGYSGWKVIDKENCTVAQDLFAELHECASFLATNQTKVSFFYSTV